MKSLIGGVGVGGGVSLTPSLGGDNLFSPALSDISVGGLDTSGGGIFSPVGEKKDNEHEGVEKKLDIDGEATNNKINKNNSNSDELSTVEEEGSCSETSSRAALSMSQNSVNFEVPQIQAQTQQQAANRISLSQSMMSNKEKSFAPSKSVKEFRESLPASDKMGPPLTLSKTPALLLAITPSSSMSSAEFDRRDNRRKSIGMKITDLMSPFPSAPDASEESEKTIR